MKSLLLSAAFILTVAANAYDSQGGFHPPGGTNPAVVTGGFAPPAGGPTTSVAKASGQAGGDTRGTSSSSTDASGTSDAGGDSKDSGKDKGKGKERKSINPNRR